MEIIRLLHILHYDVRKKRFTSPAFRNSSNGISIIDEQCIRDLGSATCEHIINYYSSIASEPPIFWRFSTDILPTPHSIVSEVSTTGDVCHYNIQGLSNKQARDFFIEHSLLKTRKDLLFTCGQQLAGVTAGERAAGAGH